MDYGNEHFVSTMMAGSEEAIRREQVRFPNKIELGIIHTYLMSIADTSRQAPPI
jgi:hypothetical protein